MYYLVCLLCLPCDLHVVLKKCLAWWVSLCSNSQSRLLLVVILPVLGHITESWEMCSICSFLSQAIWTLLTVIIGVLGSSCPPDNCVVTPADILCELPLLCTLSLLGQMKILWSFSGSGNKAVLSHRRWDYGSQSTTQTSSLAAEHTSHAAQAGKS